VPGGQVEFDLTIDAIQGTDVTVTGLVGSLPAGGSDTFSVAWDTSGKPVGTYDGLVSSALPTRRARYGSRSR
jgi:hypothetical protein